MFHLVSLSLQISLTDLPGPCLGLCVGVACFVVLGCFVVVFFLLGKFDLNHMLIPVVDRPCLALVRQCREKKKVFRDIFQNVPAPLHVLVIRVNRQEMPPTASPKAIKQSVQ